MSLQTDETIIWYGFYSANGVGKTGLADVIIYIYKDNSATPEVNGLACTELARGFYYYIQSSPTAGFRVAVMVTADTTVDQKEIPAIRNTGKGGCDYLDASVSGIPALVWLETIRDLTTPIAGGINMGATGGGIRLQVSHSPAKPGVTEIFMVRNDTKPYISFVLENDEGEPLSLTKEDKVKLIMQKIGDTTLKIDAYCDWTDVSKAEGEYRWKAVNNDTDTAGDFYGEFKIEWNDDNVQRLPAPIKLLIHIREELIAES